MSTEQLLRDRLDRMTDDVPTGPDLAASIRAGRRQRRTARAGLALAAAAVVGVGAVGVASLIGDGSATVVRDVPAADAPAAAADFVPGTQFDETLAATVAEHLPTLPAPDDVYPSDSDTKGPLPDADFAEAEDWQATYTVDGVQVLLITSTPAELVTCQQCDNTTVADGTLSRQTYDSDGLTWHGTWLTRADGSSTGLLESVRSGPATLDPAAVVALLQDPRVVFSGA